MRQGERVQVSQLPRITIVTPSYNQAQFLEETIRSVLGQSYPDLEYIVVDGASTDGSREIIERYAEQLSWWVSEKDNGHADAVNKGLAKATGEVLGFLNSDDVLFPGALQRVGEFFAANPSCFWLSGACKMFSDGPLPSGCRHKRETWRPRENLGVMDFLEGCPLAQPSVFWRRSAWVKAGPFTNEVRSFDYAYWLRLLELGYTVSSVPETLAGYRLHSDSVTVSRMESILEENHKLAFKLLPRLVATHLEREDAEQHLRAVYDLNRGPGLIEAGKKGEAIRYALGSVYRRPYLLARRATWGHLIRSILPNCCANLLLGCYHAIRGSEKDPAAREQRPYAATAVSDA